MNEIPRTGRWLVDTEHSRYIIDMDAKTATRHRVRAGAAVLPVKRDGDVVPFERIDCRVGERLFHESAWYWRRSTPVVSITEAGDA